MSGRGKTRHLGRHGFSAWLRHSHWRWHFGRHALLDHLAGHGPAPAAPDALAQPLLRAAREEPAALMARLGAHAAGLSAQEAAARRRRLGPNAVDHVAPLSLARHLWNCYCNPFNLLLSALALLSWGSGDLRATVVIGLMVLLSTLIRFVQERRSNHAAERLRALVGNTATVLRRAAQASAEGPPAAPREIPLRDLVPGDLVLLSAGDMIPADCRLLAARQLFVAQSALTGEALPVEKSAEVALAGEDAPLAQPNLVFMGTNIVSGSATALVLATGARSYFGALASRLSAEEAESGRVPNAFQTGVNSVSWLLIRFALVMVPVVLLVNGFTKGDWLQAFLFALSVAVGLTPEMLPMIVTSTLAKGAVLLSRKKVVVKRLDAIQNLGAMQVLCTDKTGTLTQDRIVLSRHVDAFGQASDEVLRLAFLNSHYQTGLKNLLDRAVLARAELVGELRLAEDWRKIDEIPFDFERRRMSVVLAERGERRLLVCKGALEEVLAVCRRVRRGEATLALEPALLAEVQQAAAALNGEGLRVVAVAQRELPPADPPRYSVADEQDLTLIGYVAFLDPPKESAAPALRALAAHGIEVKVLTGDNAAVTAQVCAQVGLPAARVLLGSELDALDDAALARVAREQRVFAKLSPLQKERLVRALRGAGQVVGFMGDGINDAPALRAADVGISVDSAVDIAKEAADIILLEKSLLVLDEGVVEGRTTFCNLLKYIRMAASSNFGNVLSVLVASAFLPFLPMLPLHLLVQNLLYDIAQTGIPFDRADAEQVQRPLAWQPADLGRFMLFFGPISSLFDLLTFALLWWVFKADSPAAQGLFQSGWFVVGLLTQTLVVHLIRTPRLAFVESRASAPLLVSTLAIMLLGLWLPQGPLAAYFKLQALPLPFFAWLLLILAGYGLLTSLMKHFYIRHFGW